MKWPRKFAEWLFRFASSQENIDRVAFWLGGTVSILGLAVAVVVLVAIILR
ncbi:hypothetical protein [Paraburkholderia acidipaludis]|uniref:hypothetical protein n=1 Tax=Paraburkholderia acidipaludis TaxID=660537 RepID=UPI001C3F1F74|nr:hypothetical protein [Paraburkholderia acidipaludis]